MISGEDIEAFKSMSSYEPYTPVDYSQWVEDKIVTSGQTRLIENILGLVGEAGEVAEKIKKLLRDKTQVTDEDIIKELGDVVFYATALSKYFNSDLQGILDKNVEKLDSRELRGVLQGSGDNR